MICIPATRFNKFVFKNGTLIEMTDTNRIGQGGFGMVFRCLFHGIPMAAKCVEISHIIEKNIIQDDPIENFLDKNLSEYRIQLATTGCGILIPVAFLRQQNQILENGKWIARNYNIFLYPLYDCNLYELHSNYFNDFNDNILGNILHQCFTRKCCLKI